MARARNIKPGIMENEDLAEVVPQGRLLFIYLWLLADREGRLEDRPKRIAARTFPYDRDVDVDALLDDLHAGGFILRYQVENCKYIQILNFSKHQNPHVKERASTIPAPCKSGASTRQAPEKTGTCPADSLIPDSLIPDSLIPDCAPLVHGALPAVTVGHSEPEQPCRTPLVLEVVESDPFDRFWDAYPRKTNKEKTRKAFPKHAAMVDRLIADIRLRLQTGHWSLDAKQFIPHPTTYLNGARWDDEIVPAHGKPMDAQSVAERTQELIREINAQQVALQ